MEPLFEELAEMTKASLESYLALAPEVAKRRAPVRSR
jgi:hypothetical protein